MLALAKILAKVFGPGKTMKLIFNLWPMYRSTGGRVIKVTDDFKYVKIKLPLTLRTRNYVGTLYGGHMYSCVDGIFMVQLINILGKDYVVWDKAASIRFRRPGNQTLYAEFVIQDAFIEQVKAELAEHGERDYTLHVNLVDKEGKVYAEVEKLLYFATKEAYKDKLARRNAQTMTQG